MSLLLVTPLAFAVDLERPLELETEGRLFEALEAFEQVHEAGGATPDELRVIYQHLSMLRHAAGDLSGARRALMKLRALTRNPVLPGMAPPEVVSMLEEISEQWNDRVLHLETESRSRSGGQAVVVTVVDDLANMVSRVEILLGAEIVDSASGRGPHRFNLDESLLSPGLVARARVLDERDSVLLEDEVELGDDPLGPSEGGDSRPAFAAGLALLVAGVTSVAAGGALVGVNGRPTGEPNRIVDGIEQELQLYTAPAGGVLIGVGAAAAIAGLVLVIAKRPGRERAAEVARRASSGIVARW